MEKNQVSQGYGHQCYRVEGVEVATKSNQGLIDFCDRNNFGGEVVRYTDTMALVTVYID